MDVDEEDEESGSSQRVSDYGIEVDFEVLSREEREVSEKRAPASLTDSGNDDFRIPLEKHLPNSMRP